MAGVIAMQFSGWENDWADHCAATAIESIVPNRGPGSEEIVRTGEVVRHLESRSKTAGG